MFTNRRAVNVGNRSDEEKIGGTMLSLGCNARRRRLLFLLAGRRQKVVPNTKPPTRPRCFQKSAGVSEVQFIDPNKSVVLNHKSGTHSASKKSDCRSLGATSCSHSFAASSVDAVSGRFSKILTKPQNTIASQNKSAIRLHT